MLQSLNYLKDLSHPNMVNIYNIYHLKDKTALVHQYFKGGFLVDWI